MHIPVSLNDVQESKPVPSGRYGLTIASVEETKTREKQKPQLKVSLGIDGHDDAPNVSHYIGLPADGDDAGAAQFKALLLKRFLAAFKIPFSSDGFDLDNFPGAQATLEVTLSEPDDNGNVYNRLTIPRLKDEANAGAGRKSPPPPKR